mmetsp:Transcript_64070/g.187473  ORF Transcript_64070/g.187473 Transcript_64070/m.187473 type:complete len:201 (-) Transcript_64070:167-769(-)
MPSKVNVLCLAVDRNKTKALAAIVHDAPQKPRTLKQPRAATRCPLCCGVMSRADLRTLRAALAVRGLIPAVFQKAHVHKRCPVRLQPSRGANLATSEALSQELDEERRGVAVRIPLARRIRDPLPCNVPRAIGPLPHLDCIRQLLHDRRAVYPQHLAAHSRGGGIVGLVRHSRRMQRQYSRSRTQVSARQLNAARSRQDR